MAKKQSTNEDDIVFEETAEGEGEAMSQDKIKKLRQQLKEAEEEAKTNLDGWQRERADFANYKKSHGEETTRAGERATENLILELLPTLDAFDMAMADESWEKADKKWRSGIEHIYTNLKRTLEDNGVTEIPAEVGDAFDPELHEPMESVKAEDEGQVDTVAKVIQKGYKIKDVVLRPVRVHVSTKES